MSINAFIDHYEKLVQTQKYPSQKLKKSMEKSKGACSCIPKDDIRRQLTNFASITVESLRTLMNVHPIPEYPVVMAMKGVERPRSSTDG